MGAQSGSKNGDMMCQYGSNCSCMGAQSGSKNGVMCTLNVPNCPCEEGRYQDGSKDGDMMCVYGGKNCASQNRCSRGGSLCFKNMKKADFMVTAMENVSDVDMTTA